MNLLSTNAELQKGLWLELSPLRLALVPAITFIIGLMVFGLEGDKIVSITAFGYVTFGALVGVYSIGRHVGDEARSGTWELQRMYPVSAWHMVWGKLLGLGSYAWYGATVVLVMGVVLAFLRHATSTPIMLIWFLGLTGTILLSHALSLLMTMMDGDSRNNRNTSMLMVALLFPVVIWPLDTTSLSDLLGYWWGLRMSPLLITLLIYVWFGWALIGCVTTMDRHMGSERGPWMWLAFTTFLVLFAAGFGVSPLRCIQFGFMTLLAVSYAGLISHTVKTMQIRRLHHLFVAGDLVQVATEMPRWMYGMAALVLLGPFIALTQWVPSDYRVMAAIYPLALVRDACIFSTMGLQRKRLPSVGLVSTYVLLVYLVLPLLLIGTGAELIAHVFIPGKMPLWGWLFIALEAALAMTYWLYTCRRQLRSQVRP